MGQRVTNGMMISTFNNNLYKNSARMERFQAQLATNRKIVRISDDPVGVIKSINARSKLGDIEQFSRNVSDAGAWMTATETAINEINTVIKRAYELTVQAANETLAPEDKAAISNEIAQLRDHVVQIGNTTLGDKYIFGGYNVTKQPYYVENADPDAPKFPDTRTIMLNGSSNELYDMLDPDLDPADLNLANTVMNYEIGFGIYMDIGIGAVDLMGGGGENNLYKILNDLGNMLNGYDEEGNEVGEEIGNKHLQPFIEKFQNSQRSALALMADLGGRQNRLELVSDRYGQDTINYTQMKSDVEDLDQAEAIMNFSMAEAVYRAALSVGAKIIQPTLVDFLR